MRSENISDALEFLDEDMIDHTETLRRIRKQRTWNWRKWCAAAACLSMVCITVIAIPGILSTQNQTEDGGGKENSISKSFTSIDSIKDNGETVSTAVTEAELQLSSVPIGEYTGVYVKVSSAESSILEENKGEALSDSTGLYSVSGHKDLQYLIQDKDQECTLWKFQYFDNSEYPFKDVLTLVYGIDGADGITEIVVSPAKMDNTTEGLKIQEIIGTHRVTERNDIETFYQILSSMTCYGSDHWESIDYGAVDAPTDTDIMSHEAVWLGRYLTITTVYGNEIDSLKYTAVSDMFYEFSGVAYNRLTEEQAENICAILEIDRSSEHELTTGDQNTDVGSVSEEQNQDTIGDFLVDFEKTDASLEYVTELQTKVSNAMVNGELPFVIYSAVYENPNRLHLKVTSDVESDIEMLKAFDTLGGVMEIEYTTQNNMLEDRFEKLEGSSNMYRQ